MTGDTKICVSCGRTMEYRKKWAKNWAEVKYCSQECRKKKSLFDYSDQILKLLSERASNATICPSEVLPLEQKQNKESLEHVRRSARLLAEADRIEITQGGRAVDPQNFRGPIRLRLRRA
jgi:hypothetical protein